MCTCSPAWLWPEAHACGLATSGLPALRKNLALAAWTSHGDRTLTSFSDCTDPRAIRCQAMYSESIQINPRWATLRRQTGCTAYAGAAPGKTPAGTVSDTWLLYEQLHPGMLHRTMIKGHRTLATSRRGAAFNQAIGKVALGTSVDAQRLPDHFRTFHDQFFGA